MQFSNKEMCLTHSCWSIMTHSLAPLPPQTAPKTCGYDRRGGRVDNRAAPCRQWTMLRQLDGITDLHQKSDGDYDHINHPLATAEPLIAADWSKV